MNVIHLHIQGDGALKGEKIAHHAEGFTLLALPRGMASGRTSIAVAISTPNGMVVAEASLGLLQAAVRALTIAHGSQDGHEPAQA